MRNIFLPLFFIALSLSVEAEDISRPIPAEWDKLVDGGRFMDRFLPMKQGVVGDSVWGCASVLGRYVDNGVESDSVSFWGGNIVKGDDGLYHFFLCGWREDNPDGHMGYKAVSTQYQAVCENSTGPFRVVRSLGKGHNSEIFKTKSGKWALYHVRGYDMKKDCKYLLFSDGFNGDFELHNLEYDLRDRPFYPGGKNWFHNMSFAPREDGSVVMVNRGGTLWVSKDGVSTFNQISDGSVYPLVDGRYEDPVIWRDNVQYNMIVNDWYGRTAFYLRSKDGIKWVVDSGQAYMPGYISIHHDGYNEQWYKYERIRVLQDEYGRAIQANFAVIDTVKLADKCSDNHSSKNISIPLNRGLLLEFMESSLNRKMKTFRVEIKGEKDFNVDEVDLLSLRFGASSHVNYGRGAKALSAVKEGESLIVTFEAKNHAIDNEEFAPKMIGKDKNGRMLFGYCRLPWVDYNPAILSARRPTLKDGKVTVLVENFGLSTSSESLIIIKQVLPSGRAVQVCSGRIDSVKSYCNRLVEMAIPAQYSLKEGSAVQVMIVGEDGCSVPYATTLKVVKKM